MHEGRTWFIPAFIPNYKEGHEPDVDDVILFTQVDPDGHNEFIPVFDNSSYCDHYIGTLNAGKRDKALCIYAFRTLSDLEKRVRSDFGREVQLIIHASDSPDGDEEEELDLFDSDDEL